MKPLPLTTSEPSTFGAFRRRDALLQFLSLGPFRAAIMILLSALGLSVCFRLAVPFLTPITAAFVMAVLFAPYHRWVTAHVAGPSLAAVISVSTIAIFVLAIAVFLVTQLVHEGVVGANLMRTAIGDGALDNLLSAHPRIAPALRSIAARLDIPELSADAATWITNVGATMLRGSFLQILGTLITFYFLLYFLRDRDDALSAVRSFLPFTPPETAFLFSRAVDTVHATIYGMVITGLLLGIFGGMIFAVVGLPAPVLWGIVMAAFAILPVLGVGMIWIPAAALLLLNGDWSRAVILIVAFLALAVADSIYYPHLVGDRMKLHTAVAFTAAVGGLLLFGAVGFILGPLVVALTLAVSDILRARLHTSAPLISSL